MGLLQDGTVVPTPRDRVMEVAEEKDLQEHMREGVAFELFYSDMSMVSGTSIQDWNAAPDDDVQYAVVLKGNGTVWQITGPEIYVYQPGSQPKSGLWMDDTIFFTTLRDAIGPMSQLL